MTPYYYFVASLDELHFEKEKLPQTLNQFIEEALYETEPGDHKLINSIRLHYDNENLINSVEKKNDQFNSFGMFSKEHMQNALKEPEILPTYMQDFIERYLNGERDQPQSSLEDELATKYFNTFSELDNNFIQDYFNFDFNLKNSIVALNCRKYSWNPEQFILPVNEEAQNFIYNRTNDFNLSSDFDWLPKVINDFNESGPLGRKKLDFLRFDYIDSLLEYEYFNINNILGHFLKLIILERWSRINTKDGKSVFEELTNKLSRNKKLTEYNL